MSHKEMIYLKGLSKGMGLYNTLKAINIANILHEGQKRRTGEDYIIHPVRVASALSALGIHDDSILATALLHDVIEDCGITKDQLIHQYGLNPQIAENVQILSKNKDMSTKVYYERISSNPTCLLVKISDRCHNVSSMVGGFTPEKMKSYIEETEEYIYPLCKYGKNFYPEYSDQIFSMKYQIESVLLVVKSFVHMYEKTKSINEEVTLGRTDETLSPLC
jgi:GTP pyrophosphokinase